MTLIQFWLIGWLIPVGYYGNSFAEKEIDAVDFFLYCLISFFIWPGWIGGTIATLKRYLLRDT